MAKLTGIELVKERRELPRDHPAYSLPRDLTTIEAHAAEAPIYADHICVYIEVGNVRLKVIDEVDGMYDHFVTDHGIRRIYREIAGVEVTLEER